MTERQKIIFPKVKLSAVLCKLYREESLDKKIKKFFPKLVSPKTPDIFSST